METYDLIVLGTGPAGMAAAIYSGRYDLKTLVVGKEVGGMVNLAGEIENYPGFIGSGIDLMLKFKEQAEKFGAEFVVGEVNDIYKSEGDFKVRVGDEVFCSRVVISALGSRHRKLGIPGEEKFLGKGVSYCATCDGNFFRGKKVVVVGGSDAAAKAIIVLDSVCEKVYVSYRREKMRCEPIYLKKIEKMDNVEIIYNTIVTEIIGKDVVEGVRILTNSEGSQSSIVDGSSDVPMEGSASPETGATEKILDVDGVFVEIGSEPVTDIFEGLGVELDKGYIKVDREGRTSVEGLFAAGDLTNNPFKQAITAASDGAIAAKSVFEYLAKRE